MCFMNTYLDSFYASILCRRFRNHRIVNRSVHNFSCPLCGDSEKNKLKARGYVFPDRKSGGMFYKCHNCGEALPFKAFLKETDSDLYNEYVMESIKQTKRTEQLPDIPKTKPIFYNTMNDVFGGYPTIAQLPNDNSVKQYIAVERKIPTKFHTRMFWIEDFRTFANLHRPGSFKHNIDKLEPRIAIPITYQGTVVGCSARYMGDDPGAPKYYTLRFADVEQERMIYGLDDLDHNQTVYVLEGPLDSMFLPNAVALSSSKLESFKHPKAVYIHDNQPRNKEIVKIVRACVMHGHNVFIWPEGLENYKDVNDLIKTGMTPAEVLQVINTNTFAGLSAELQFTNWSKTGR